MKAPYLHESFEEWYEKLEMDSPEKMKELVWIYLMQTHTREQFYIPDPIISMLEYIIDNEWDSVWNWLQDDENEAWMEFLEMQYELEEYKHV